MDSGQPKTIICLLGKLVSKSWKVCKILFSAKVLTCRPLPKMNLWQFFSMNFSKILDQLILKAHVNSCYSGHPLCLFLLECWLSNKILKNKVYRICRVSWGISEKWGEDDFSLGVVDHIYVKVQQENTARLG